MTIQIQKTADWEELSKQGLSTVVDPMIFRCGELFLRGTSGQENEANARDLLSANIDGIGMFFDRLILDSKLPVFNYGDTFDASLNFDQRTLTRINERGQILFDVDVEDDAYHEVKSAALEELKKLYEGPPIIEKKLASDIFSELSTAEYKWNPSLEDLENRLTSEEEKQLAAFFLGGLIFGGYAQQLESEHLLQPKRSRLFVAAALSAHSSDHKLEDELFKELKARANTRCEDLPWVPTFFPYLLSKANTPTDVLKEVVDLRRSREVADYRDWLKEAITEWQRDGKISVKKRNDVQTIVRAVDQRLSVASWAPKVEVKATVADAIAMKPPGSIDFTPTLKALWGWALATWPGKRYRKLLTRAVAAENELRGLENLVWRVWNAG